MYVTITGTYNTFCFLQNLKKSNDFTNKFASCHCNEAYTRLSTIRHPPEKLNNPFNNRGIIQVIEFYSILYDVKATIQSDRKSQ